MLSNTTKGSSSRKYDNRALRRSSSFVDQAAAGAGVPSVAVETMFSVVVFPPPRFPPMIEKPGPEVFLSESVKLKHFCGIRLTLGLRL